MDVEIVVPSEFQVRRWTSDATDEELGDTHECFVSVTVFPTVRVR